MSILSDIFFALASTHLRDCIGGTDDGDRPDVAEGVWRAVDGGTGAMRFRPAPTPSRWRTVASAGGTPALVDFRRASARV